MCQERSDLAGSSKLSSPKAPRGQCYTMRIAYQSSCIALLEIYLFLTAIDWDSCCGSIHICLKRFNPRTQNDILWCVPGVAKISLFSCRLSQLQLLFSNVRNSIRRNTDIWKNLIVANLKQRIKGVYFIFHSVDIVPRRALYNGLSLYVL